VIGVTMLQRQTALEFPGIQHGHALRDFRDRRVTAHAHRAARLAEPSAPNSLRVDTLERLAALRERGMISDEEYQAEKTVVMTNAR